MKSTPKERLKELTSIIIVLFDGLGFGLLAPLLPFMMIEFDTGPAAITLLVSLYALTSFLGAIMAGDLSDKYGRIIVLKVTILGTLVAYSGILWLWSLPALFFFRALTGLMTGRDAVIKAMITDNSSSSEHVRQLANVSAAFAVGGTLGFGFSSLIGLATASETQHFQLIHVIAIGLTILTLILAQFSWPKHNSIQVAALDKSKVAKLPILAAAWSPLSLAFIGSFSYATLAAVTALFAYEAFDWTAIELGWLLCFVTLGVVGARVWIVPALAKQFGLLGATGIYAGCGVISLIWVAFSVSTLSFSLGTLGIAFSTTGISIMANVIIGQQAPSESRGMLMGAAQAFATLGLFFGAAIDGVLFEVFSRELPFIVAAAVVLLTLPILMISRAAANQKREA